MKFDQLLKLINESADSSLLNYSNKLKAAYKVFFDLDDGDFVSVEKTDYLAPSYCHDYLKVNLEFFYNNKKYKTYHALYHYKIPYSSIKAVKKEDWDDFLKQMEQFDKVALSDDLLKTKNVQVKTVVSIYEIISELDKFDLVKRKELGKITMYSSLSEIVQKVKSIIDSQKGGEQEEEFVSPKSPSFHLTPA